MKLELNNVQKQFQTSSGAVSVINGISLKIESGQRVAIIGPSGSGKSTLLSLLAGLELPSSGEVQLNDIDLARLSENERTTFRGKNLGIVFQNFHLIDHLTALENVLLPAEINGQGDGSMAEKILSSVGLAHRKNHFPSQLSGGEQQRVAIARALINSPKLLLADEPTGSLDEDTGESIIKLIFDLVDNRQQTTIIVTHNIELANRCDVVFKITQGKIERIK